MYTGKQPPQELMFAVAMLFDHHQQLSDFIMGKGGIKCDLKKLHEDSRVGKFHANDDVTIWMRRFVDAIRDEVDELSECMPWKWWRNETTDMQNVRIELVDIFHFLMSACIASGMTGQEFIQLYYEKRRLNYDRQFEGFKKDDNRALGGYIPCSSDSQPESGS